MVETAVSKGELRFVMQFKAPEVEMDGGNYDVVADSFVISCGRY